MNKHELGRMIVGSALVGLFIFCGCSRETNIHKEYFVQWENVPKATLPLNGLHSAGGAVFFVKSDSVYIVEGGDVVEIQPVRDRQWIGGNKAQISVSDSIRVWR